MKRVMPALQTDIATPKAAPGFTEGELDLVESGHPQGLTTQQVVELFTGRGARLSEATFRKYVQLGLLPRSVRVGLKGKHRGSQGLYPASVVRQIELIRQLMGQGYTIQEIKREFLFLRTDIDALSRQLDEVLSTIEKAIEAGGTGDAADEVVSRVLREAHGEADDLIRKLRAIEQRLAMRARMARAVV